MNPTPNPTFEEKDFSEKKYLESELYEKFNGNRRQQKRSKKKIRYKYKKK